MVRMRALLVASLIALASLAVTAQDLALKPASVQHVTVTSGVSGVVTPGARITLWVDVAPNAGMRVYAAGAKDFLPVALVMTPHAAATPAKAAYPPSELDAHSGAPGPVPVYTHTFRITQPVTISRTAKAGDTFTLAAAVNYQACNDRLCYPAASAPVLWSLQVR